ncbi:MAG: peptidylprolyl isomerase [Bacteroidales bacterium]|nr:peptidylprolyl isomerase [Bacteroidales bacterium]
MKRCIFFTLMSLIVVFKGYAQNNDPVLMTINDKKITKSEFERIFHKNNKDSVTDEKSVREYLDLFINFKLKVFEAIANGLDTAQNFKQELQNYRKQLTAPYFVDKETEEKLVREAYERKKIRIRTSHILIKVPENASPADTLAAYNKAIDIRNRILKGEDFAKLANEFSQDDVSKINGGDIGYLTVFTTVLPYENAAYSLKPGEISMPVRSQYGYHIIKVTDRKENPGDVKVAHIMALVARDASEEDVKKAEQKINEAYQKLLQGEDFAKVAMDYSDDKASAKRGGDLPWFGTGRMVPEFETAAFDTKVGEITKPFRTAFGFHIIKKIETRPIAAFESERNDLAQKIAKDPRAQQSKNVLIEKLKKEYNYTFNKKNLDEIIAFVDTNLYSGNFKAPKTAKLDKPLFTLKDSTYIQKQFVQYLSNYKSKSKEKATNETAKELAKQLYKNWENEKIVAYEDARLETKYPAFANLLQEYHDGILLFDLTDKMVWSKAIKDTVGLKEFYEKNKNKYMWDTRAEAIWITYENDKCKDALIKAIENNKKQQTIDDILKSINKKSTCLTKKDTKLISKGEMPGIDKIAFNEDKTQNKKYTLFEDKKLIIYINAMVPPQPKQLHETKGVVTADYQSYLEKQWIDELRKKYTVKVNEEVLKQVK